MYGALGLSTNPPKPRRKLVVIFFISFAVKRSESKKTQNILIVEIKIY